MQIWARVPSGVVAEIITIPDNVDIATRYTAELVATMIPADPTVREGWIWNGSVFAAPALAPPPTPPTLDQIYDATLLNSQVLKAVVKSIIDGTLVAGLSNAQAKNVIKANM